MKKFVLILLAIIVCLTGCSSQQKIETVEPDIPQPSQTQVDVFPQVKDLIEQKKYPQALALLSSMEDQTELYNKLRYIVDGSYIHADAFGVAAITADGNMKVVTGLNNQYTSKLLSAVTKWEKVTSIGEVDVELSAIAIDKSGKPMIYSYSSAQDLIDTQNDSNIEMAKLMQFVDTWGDMAVIDTTYP